MLWYLNGPCFRAQISEPVMEYVKLSLQVKGVHRTKLLTINVINCRRHFSSFLRISLISKIYFILPRSIFWQCWIWATSSVRKFSFLSFAAQTDRLSRQGKLKTLRVCGVAIILYRDNHLSVQGSHEKTESELPLSDILVFWKAAAESCYRSVKLLIVTCS